MSDNDLIFLVQLNSGPTAGKHKSVINAHISKQAHIRRRKRAQQASIDSQQIATTSVLSSPSPALATSNTVKAALEVLAQEQLSCPISPRNRIRGGSLDPFDALQCRTDRKAQRYLSFGRDALEAAIHGAGWRGWPRSVTQRKHFVGPDLIAGHNVLATATHLEHPICFMVIIYGVLAYCASGVAAISADADARQDALRYATEGMKCMRRYLDVVDRDLDRISEELVYRLFRAEVLAENHASALIHGQLLKIVLEHKSKSSGLRLDVLSNALFQNGHWMFSSWTRSIFDARWIAEQYQMVWDEVDEIFANELNFDERDLNPCIINGHLRKLSILTKRLFLQSRIGTTQNAKAPFEQHYSLATKCEWLQIMWMEYYLNHERANMNGDFATTLGHEIDMCLTLSTLYVLRHSKNDPFVNGRPLFRGSLRIFQSLHARLSGVSHTEIDRRVPSRADALIYVLYVNAVAAAYVRGIPGEQDKANACYHVLKQLISQGGVDNWPSLLALLETFPFMEDELPQPYPGWCEDLFKKVV